MGTQSIGIGLETLNVSKLFGKMESNTIGKRSLYQLFPPNPFHAFEDAKEQLRQPTSDIFMHMNKLIN